MPNISSPLGTTQPYIPAVQSTQIGRFAGLHMHFPTLAALNAAITEERSNIVANSGIWAQNQAFTVATEVEGTFRLWDATAQNARRVWLAPGVIVTLSNDTGTVRKTTGVPNSGTGLNGDIAIDFDEGIYFVKSGGSWSIGGPITAKTNAITTTVNSVSCQEDSSVSGNVLADDSTSTGTLSLVMFSVSGFPGVYRPGETATITNIGSLTIQANGNFTFTPVQNYNGYCPFITYQVANGTTANISYLLINVIGVPDAPVVLNDSVFGLMNEDFEADPLFNDVSLDGGTLSITKVNGVNITINGPAVAFSHGTARLVTGQKLILHSDLDYSGTTSFTYTVVDSANGLTGTATVAVKFIDPLADPVTYWVDPNALDDNGDGSFLSPKKYIRSATDLMSPYGNDVTCLKDGVYSHPTLDCILHPTQGIPGRMNTIKAQNRRGATLTAGIFLNLRFEDDMPYDWQLRFEDLNFDDQFSKGVTGSNIKFLRCFFRGGPTEGNTNNMGCGTNDHLPGSEYILFQDCLFYGIGGRYTFLAYDSDKIVIRRCVFRHVPGWNITGGNPQGSISIYNCVNVEVMDILVIDSLGMDNFEAGYYHPSNNRASANIRDRHVMCYNIASNGIAWDDGATTPNMTCEHSAFINCGSPGAVNGGAKDVTMSNITAYNCTGNFRNFSSTGTLRLRNSITYDLTSGTNINGVNLDGSNVFFNPPIPGEHEIDPTVNGLKYPTRIEAGSLLESMGVGATILKKIGVDDTGWGETGFDQITNNNLWPWPYEDEILAALKADDDTIGVALAGAKQLDGVSPVTVTSYMWEALGYPIPEGVYPPTAVPSMLTAPVVTGEFVEGGIMTTTLGTWTGAPDSYTIAWLRNGVPISGATGTSYTGQSADVGTSIRSRVIANNALGPSSPALSTSTLVIAATAPNFTVVPTISPTVGLVGTTFTVNNGVQNGLPTPTYAYQAKLDGSNVGDSSGVYIATAPGSLAWQVTATNIAGSDTETTSPVLVYAVAKITDTLVESSPPVILEAHTATGTNGGFTWAKAIGQNNNTFRIISGGRLRVVNSNQAFQAYLAQQSPTSAVQIARATIGFGSTGRTSFYLGCRCSDDGLTGYYAYQSDGKWYLLRQAGLTSFVPLGEATQLQPGEYNIEIEAFGSSIKVRRNNVTIISATDSVLTSPGKYAVASNYTEGEDANYLKAFEGLWAA